MGPDGGYRLDAGAELPPLLFDDNQALALAIALRAAPALSADFGEAAVRAFGTMRQVLPPRRCAGCGSFARRPAHPGAGGARPGHGALRLPAAGRGSASARRIEPHHLVASHGRSYVLGWDLEREGWRLFSADRVRPRVPHGAPFVPRVVPGGDIDAFVSARFNGSDTNEWPCRGTVLLQAPARDVLPFAGDGVVTAVDDERCTLEVGSWSWGALAASFGRFEVAMEVVGPPS